MANDGSGVSFVKQPWLKFYPNDWRADRALGMCSMAARGLWMEMICLMHEGEPYGTLVVNGTKIDERSLGHLVRADPRSIKVWLKELERFKVFERDESGTIFSKRMVRDHKRSQTYSANGKAGGNPELLKQKDKPPDKPPDKQEVKGGDNTQKLEARSYIESKNPPLPPLRGDAHKRPRKKPKTSLPKDFQLSEEDRNFARNRGWSESRLNCEFGRMCDHAQATGREQVDWHATWRTWVTSKFQDLNGGAVNGQPAGIQISARPNSAAQFARRQYEQEHGNLFGAPSGGSEELGVVVGVVSKN